MFKKTKPCPKTCRYTTSPVKYIPMSTPPRAISNTGSPYCFAHCVAESQSSLAVKSFIFPTNGRGFGPGGKDAVEALDFRIQMKRATRRLASPAKEEVLIVMDMLRHAVLPDSRFKKKKDIAKGERLERVQEGTGPRPIRRFSLVYYSQRTCDLSHEIGQVSPCHEDTIVGGFYPFVRSWRSGLVANRRVSAPLLNDAFSLKM